MSEGLANCIADVTARCASRCAQHYADMTQIISFGPRTNLKKIANLQLPLSVGSSCKTSQRQPRQVPGGPETYGIQGGSERVQHVENSFVKNTIPVGHIAAVHKVQLSYWSSWRFMSHVANTHCDQLFIICVIYDSFVDKISQLEC